MSLKAVAYEGNNLYLCGTKWIDVCVANKEVLLTQIFVQTKKNPSYLSKENILVNTRDLQDFQMT